jgi:hypothetical protein
MSEIMSVSQRTIERTLSYLQNHGILKHEGSDRKIILYFVFLSERDTFTKVIAAIPCGVMADAIHSVPTFQRWGY